jgi:hypothetical protein
MPIVDIEPSDDYPVPYDDTDDVPESFEDRLIAAANTAELQHALGAEIDEAELGDVINADLLAAAIESKSKRALKTPAVALAGASFLREYGARVALDVAAVRSAITHKLMELANCGDPKYELKALELLGKHSDIGLFTERSEITINYKDPADLENAIKERVKRLLNAELIDVTPNRIDLDEELGAIKPLGRIEPEAEESEAPETSEAEATDDDGLG